MTNMFGRLLALACLLVAVAAPAAELQLADIFGPDAVRPDARPAHHWMGADAYSTVEDVPGIGPEVVMHEVATGRRTVLLAARDMPRDGSGQPLQVVDHAWSGDRAWLLLRTRAAGFRRYNPAMRHWLVEVATGRVRRLGASLGDAEQMHADFSPDSASIAFVHGNDLYVELLRDGRATRLTRDGSPLVLNGRADVAYEEEFGLGKAYAWSPDSRRIAFWRFDTSPVGVFSWVDNAAGQYAEVVAQRYPKPGTALSAVRVGSVVVADGATTWFELGGEGEEQYVPRMAWTPDARALVVQRINRRQNHNTVLRVDATTGRATPLFTEVDEAWVDVNDPQWVDGEHFTWLSERGGWRQLYTASVKDGRLELRTPGAFDVVRVEAVDGANANAYFIASPDEPGQRYLYRVALSGEVKVERVTPPDAAGTHGYDIAPGAHHAVHTWSSFGTPPVTQLVRLPDHAVQRTLSDNAAMRALVEATPRGEVEFFRVQAQDGLALDGWMMKPPGFDPRRKYPLLMYVYSEPAGQTVQDTWAGERYLWHLMLTQRGYLVASVDSRGANAPRGRQWRKSIYRQVGVVASRDQADAVRALVRDRPYVDGTRIGIWGRSGGGAMTLNALFRYPDLYAAGIAIAGPTDQGLYNAPYQERYMGLPSDNPEGYRDGSPVNFADRLQGALLIVHGTADDNVHYQNLERLVDRLVEHGKPFSMMAYPGRGHGVSEKPGTRLHLHAMMTDFLERNLKHRP